MSLPKPLGVQLSRGKDGAAYVTKSSSDIGNTDGQIEVGHLLISHLTSICSDKHLLPYQGTPRLQRLTAAQ